MDCRRATPERWAWEVVGKEKLAAQLFGGNTDAAGVSFSLKQIPPATQDEYESQGGSTQSR